MDPDGRVRVVDTLGLTLPPGVSALQLLSSPVNGNASDLALDPATSERLSHDASYGAGLCKLDSCVARSNADTHGPDALRSEGKALILASIHSTFPKPVKSETLWVSCSDFSTAHRIRALCLRDPVTLPSQMEYMDADSYSIVDRSGRALCLAIRAVGIGTRLRQVGRWWLYRIEPDLSMLCWNDIFLRHPLPAPLLFNRCGMPSSGSSLNQAASA